MTAMHLLSDLRAEGVTVHLDPGAVLVLTLPSAVVLRGLPVPGRDWSAGLCALVAQHDDYTRMLLDCAQMSWASAEALAWRLVVAGYAGPGA